MRYASAGKLTRGAKVGPVSGFLGGKDLTGRFLIVQLRPCVNSLFFAAVSFPPLPRRHRLVARHPGGI